MAAPTGTRGAGYGLDAALARKAQEKYSPELEAQAQQWIEQVTGVQFNAAFADFLRDGQALCNLANAIQPGAIRRVETSRMPFKQMENISNFLRACRAIGVAEHDLFETVDLFEQKDLGVVVNCIHALGRAAQNVSGFRGPYLGPREAQSNRRTFTEAQRKSNAATAGMTKLSMGSSQVMQRSHIDTSNSITYGAEKAGTGSSAAVSRWNQGSAGTMDRSAIDATRNITFGAQATVGSNVPSAAPAHQAQPLPLQGGAGAAAAPAPAAAAGGIPAPPPRAARPNFCSECGASTGTSAAKFCSQCGNRL